MRLSTEDVVLGLLGVQSNAGSISNAGVALDLTGYGIESVLGTSLERATITDTFSYLPKLVGYKSEVLELRLSAGFVQTVPAIDIKSEGVAVPDAVVTYKINTDYTSGILSISSDVFLTYSSLDITYSAGFTYLNNQTKLLKNVPNWLSSAGAVAAARLLLTSPAVVASKKAQSSVRDVSLVVSDDLSRLLNSHIRPRLNLIWPDRSVRS